jgi:hypothetical protein
MIIALIVLGVLILGTAIAGVICYYTLALPNMKPLAAEERAICERLVRQGKGYPFMCAHAVKTGQCACLPCRRLEEAKKGA